MMENLGKIERGALIIVNAYAQGLKHGREGR